MEFVPADEPLPMEPPGSEGSATLGLGVGLVYDASHNFFNVRDGLFSELALVRYAGSWGRDFTFTSLSDTRLYKSINSGDVLDFQLLGDFNFGNVPFNQLALLGGESLMRGYYMGRYRDKN